MSNLSAFPFIQERSEGTPGLWNNIFSILSANDAALNSTATISFPSGNTLSVFSSIDASGNLHAGNRIGVGATPSADTVEVLTIGADSSKSDYILFHDPTGAKSSYLVGSRVGGTADGLNIYDASGSTMIASFSKQSIRFFQNVVGPVFDVGGALASTYNAGTFGTGADSKESRIQSAINQASIDGFARVYVPASMYPYSASSVSFIHTIQMVREGGNWAVFDVKAYGASGNSIAIDTSAIVAAVAGAQQAGGGQIYFTGGTYNLGNHSDPSGNSGVVSITSANKLTFAGGPATLIMNTTDATQTTFLRFNNPQKINLYDLYFRDNGADVSVDFRGAHCIRLVGSGVTANYEGIQITGCQADNVLAFITLGNTFDTPARVRDITISNCIVRNAYYGLVAQENGDGVHATFRAENVRRAYFAYGVTDHTVDVSISHNGVAPGSNGACVIKRYTRNTSDIRLRALYSGAAGNSNVVKIEHAAPASDGVISNVDARVDYRSLTGATSMRPFVIASNANSGGVETEETSITSNRWDNIKLAGTFEGWSNPNGRFNGSAPIYLAVTQLTEGRMILDPSMAPWMTTVDGIHFPGFAVSRGMSGDVLRTKSGAAVVNSAFSIPLAAFNGFGGIMPRIKITAVDDYSVGTTQNVTVREDVLVGFNPGGSALSIQQVNNIYNIVQGSAASATYAVSGETLTINLTGSAYSNISAWAWCEIRHEGVFV